MRELKKKDIIYFTRIIPSHGIFDIYELIVRTVENGWFVGTDKKDKHAFLFNNADIGEIVFFDRKLALEKTKEAEKNKKITINEETYYEEY